MKEINAKKAEMYSILLNFSKPLETNNIGAYLYKCVHLHRLALFTLYLFIERE